MRGLVLAGLAGLLVLIVTAAMTLPARMVPLLLDESLLLSGFTGSVWQGRAARAVLRSPRGDLHLGELRWSLSATSLLRFAPELELRTTWGQQRAVFRLRSTGSRLLLRDIDAVFSASLLSKLLPVRVGGRLSLLFDELEIREGNPVKADGRIVWQDADWFSTQGRHALGSYAADLVSSDDLVIAATLRTIRGPVIAEGELRYSAPAYSVDARITAQDELHPDLARALSLIASPLENGYLLRLEGDLDSSP